MGPGRKNRIKARCPECLAPIWFRDDVELWDPATCPECHVALEVVNLRPLELDYMSSDWNDDDDDDDEEDEWD